MKHMISNESKILAIVLMVFILISILYIGPERDTQGILYHSSQLQKNTIRDGNTERTDYLNEDGDLTFASDIGYATCIITSKAGTKLEQYYDESGKPICRSLGYYAVLREFDDLGNNIRNIYLDREGEPVVTIKGYAIIEREYNKKGQVVLTTYYDGDGYPATLTSFEHGKKNEYDENDMICKTIFIDVSGNPIMTRQGYAIITYNYYTSDGPENGKVEKELYFDESGIPVSLSLGQYGVHKEYDEYGRQAVLTYLDAAGKPTVTKRGYTTVIRTFFADNSVATERYLDIDGNPFSLPEGQYGVETISGQTVYLDKNGDELFNLKNLLYNHPQNIIIVAMVIVLLSVVFSKKWNIAFAIGYIIAIAYLTLMFRETDGATLKLEPFWSYRKLLTDSATRADILKNIWLFIPLGAILYRINPNAKVLLIPVGLSILIEAIQYFVGLGFCELDDVISNGLGGVIGYGMGCQAKMIRNLSLREKHKHIRTA